MRQPVTRVVVFAATVLSIWLLAAAGVASAATCDDYWTHPAGGDWATASNWSAGVPNAGTNVCLDNTDVAGSYTVDIDTYTPALVANSITVGGSTGNTVTLSILGTGGGVQVGDKLTLTDQDAGGGILPTGALTLGMAEAGGIGQPGELDVTAGTLLNQGTVTSTPTSQSGQSNTIDGGFDNAGTLNVAQRLTGNGPDTNSGTITIPSGITLEFDYSGSGSSFTQTGGLIANQGTFTEIDGTFVGLAGTSTGNPLGLTSDNAGITVDPSGTGSDSLHIQTGGATLGSGIGAGYTVWASGIPGYSHGNLTVQSPVVNAGTLELGSSDGTHGTLTVSAGSFTNNGTLVFEQANGADGLNGPLINDAVVQAPDSVVGTGQITNNGSFAVAAGQTIAATSYAQGAAGTLSLALAAGSIPELQLTGAASLAGTLAVSTAGTLTGTFPVIAAGSLNGTFAATPFAGEAYSLAYSATGLSLTAPAATPAPTPAPTPILTPAPAASAVRVGSVAGGRGAITIRFSCPSGATCRAATVRATVIEHRTGSRITSITASARKTGARAKRVLIASATVTLKSGSTRTLTLELGATGRALLKRFGSLAATLTVGSGGKTVKSATVHIRKSTTVKKKHTK